MDETFQFVNTLLYESDEGAVSINVVIDKDNETMWATQKTMAELFNVSKSTISEHLKHIFEEGELNKNSTVRKIRTVQIEGNREVKRQTTFYNLDAIISVGYRVNSWNRDIYITGSNSKLLSGELATHLTGRYFEVKMYPFSFNEFLDYKQQSSSDELFNEYVEYGGFPQLFSLNDEDKLKYLHDLFNSILYNDLISRYHIRDVNILERLIIFLMDNVGKTFSAKSISDYLKQGENVKVAPKTIYKYIDYFTNSLLIKKVQRENVEGKEILKIHEKYYVTDHGFNQVFNGRNLTNVSRTIENIVYVELLREGYDVTVGKIGDFEIDFIAKKHKSKVYIQVTYSLSSDETIEREFRPLLKIKDNYPKYVISTDKFDFSQEGVIHQNLIDFLLNGLKY